MKKHYPLLVVNRNFSIRFHKGLNSGIGGGAFIE